MKVAANERVELRLLRRFFAEACETWLYLDQVMRPYLREVGIEVEIAPRSLATRDLYGGEDENTLLIPAYTAEGKGNAWCSGY